MAGIRRQTCFLEAIGEISIKLRKGSVKDLLFEVTVSECLNKDVAESGENIGILGKSQFSCFESALELSTGHYKTNH